TNMQELLQGFFFADFREKGDTAPFNGTPSAFTNVGTTNDRYEASGAALKLYQAGALLFASGFTNADNNGLKTVDTTTTDVTIDVAENLVDEASPPDDARIVEVGFQFAADEVDIDVSGSLPKLVLGSSLVAATSTLTL